MKRITYPVLLMVMVLLWTRPVCGAAPVAISLDSLLSTLTYGYDNGQFSGDFGFTIYGVESGEVKTVIESADGKVVFERVLPCESTYSSDNSPACYMNSGEQKPAKPFAAQSGQYILKLIMDGQTIYTFQYTLKVDNEYDYNNVYVTGDWDRLAIVDFSSEPGMTVRVTMGGQDQCNEKTEDVQAQLFRNGELVGRGHIEGAYSPGCSLSESTIMLFSTDANNLTEWVSGKKQIFREGEYELKLFRDKKLAATYAFSLKEGSATSVAPAGLQPGLHPDQVRATEQAFIIYEK